MDDVALTRTLYLPIAYAAICTRNNVKYLITASRHINSADIAYTPRECSVDGHTWRSRSSEGGRGGPADRRCYFRRRRLIYDVGMTMLIERVERHRSGGYVRYIFLSSRSWPYVSRGFSSCQRTKGKAFKYRFRQGLVTLVYAKSSQKFQHVPSYSHVRGR